MNVRSEASQKAWDTRRAAAKAKAEAMKAVPAQGGITVGQSQHLRNLTSFVFEKREAFAAAEQELRDAEQALSAFIESITAK